MIQAKIKYTVKHHPTLIKKIAECIMTIGGLIGLLAALPYFFMGSLSTEMSMLMISILPDLLTDIAFICLLIVLAGALLRYTRWRYGTVALADDRLTITGSYSTSIRIQNIYEIIIIDRKNRRHTIRIDSKTDAVQLVYRNKKDFELFQERLEIVTMNRDDVRWDWSF